MNTAAEFWALVNKDGPYSKRLKSNCWEWTGARCPITWGDNYGRVYWKGRGYNAHRIAWEIEHGVAVPAGLDACHACDNPPCVNPAHVWIGTRQHNAIDRALKGRGGRVRDHYFERGVDRAIEGKRAGNLRSIHEEAA